ncbi:hypothetical protein ACSBR2_004376 [Camellia fascicularis]
MSGPIFSDILKTLNPDLVIYDHNQPWVATIASSHNIPAVQFLIFGVVSSSFTLHMFKKPGKLFLFEEIFFRGFKPLMSRNMVESSVEEVRKDKFPLGEKIRVSETLPEGFLVRVGERGLIVEGQAPQAKILRHSAMPMQLDQPLNVRLVEEVGVGLEVMRDENERFNEKEIAQVIRKFMVEENGEVSYGNITGSNMGMTME